MTKTKKVVMSTIATFALAACTFATLGMAKGTSANAAEKEPVYAQEGWYVVGNGAGSLKDCSWLNYVPEYKLEQLGDTAYIGEFEIELDLYAGDAFKLLYANGEWEWTSDSGWKTEYMAQYSDLSDPTNFVNGGLGNIQAKQDGKYSILLIVEQDEAGAVTTTVEATRKGDVTPIVMEEMYVVGSLANYPTCNWPGAIDVATKCPAMSYNATTKKWTVTLNLVAGDEFKVYNLISNAYYPGGIVGNYVVAVTGTYEVEWESAAPDFIVTPVVTPAE